MASNAASSEGTIIPAMAIVATNSNSPCDRLWHSAAAAAVAAASAEGRASAGEAQQEGAVGAVQPLQ